MIVRNVIIVSTAAGDACSDGTIDRVIERVLKLGKTPILVVGPEGDDVLRSTRRIESCELVFDPNYQGHLFSSIKAGLQAAQGAAFLIVLSEWADQGLWDAIEAWRDLEQKLRGPSSPQPDKKDEWSECDLLLPVTRDSNHSRRDIPPLITSLGAKNLLQLPAQTDWAKEVQLANQASSPLSAEFSGGASSGFSVQKIAL